METWRPSCSPVFAGVVETPRGPLLRLYEFDRALETTWQVDLFLPADGDVGEDFFELLVFERLWQVVIGAALDGANGCSDIGIGRDDHYIRIGIGLLLLIEKLQAIAIRKAPSNSAQMLRLPSS